MVREKFGSKYHFSSLVHSTHTYLPMKMEQTGCSETSAYKFQTPRNYPKESIQQHSFFTAEDSRMHQKSLSVSNY